MGIKSNQVFSSLFSAISRIFSPFSKYEGHFNKCLYIFRALFLKLLSGWQLHYTRF